MPKAGASLATIQRFTEKVKDYKKSKTALESAKKSLNAIR